MLTINLSTKTVNHQREKQTFSSFSCHPYHPSELRVTKKLDHKIEIPGSHINTSLLHTVCISDANFPTSNHYFLAVSLPRWLIVLANFDRNLEILRECNEL